MNIPQNPKILLVDDSDFSRSMIKRMLVEAELNVVAEARNAEEALAMVKEHQPQIVITDIVMPKVSGIELTSQLTKQYPDISVIVISSLSQEHIVLEAIGAGASDFVAKPIQAQQLIDSINKVLASR